MVIIFTAHNVRVAIYASLAGRPEFCPSRSAFRHHPRWNVSCPAADSMFYYTAIDILH